MEVIAHTAIIKKDKEGLTALLENNLYTKIELDFVLTKDYIPVWSHDTKIDGLNIKDKSAKELKFLLTLDEVLEIVNNKKKLLIEIKFPRKDKEFNCKMIEILKKINNIKDIQIQSFDPIFITELLKHRELFPDIEIGLIINFFKTFNYRKKDITKLKDIDFISLSSELFEFPIVGKDYLIYRKLFSHAKEYAWTWDAVYKDREKRIKNYIECGADGIITLNPQLVKRIIKDSKRGD